MSVFNRQRWQGVRRRVSGCAEALARFHRDERGDMLEYALVFVAIAVPLIALFYRLFYVLAEYFGMVAFYVTWPFI